MTFIEADDLRQTLGNKAAADDAELTSACEVACSVLERGWNGHPGVGIVVQSTVTGERVRGRSHTLVLANRALSVTSITDERTGVALDPEGFAIDGQFLHTKSGDRIPHEWLSITYEAGHVASDAAVPEWARSAALGIAGQVFRQRFKLGQQVDGPVGFLVPNLVESMVQPYLLLSLGFA